MKRLQNSGLTTHDVVQDGDPKEKRDYVDLEIESRLNIWAVLHRPPAPVILMTDDKDYVRLIERLKRWGFIVHLVVGASPNKELLAYNKEHLNWLTAIFQRIPKPLSIQEEPLLRKVIQRSEKPGLVMVLWDLKSCSIPEGVFATGIYYSINEALKNMGFLGVYRVEVFLQSGTGISKTVKNYLKKSGMTVRSLGLPVKGGLSLERDHVDMRMKKAMCHWALSREPSTMMVISNDERLAWTARQLRDNANFEMILAHDESAPENLKVAFTHTLLLNSIISISGSSGDSKKKRKEKEGDESVKPKRVKNK